MKNYWRSLEEKYNPEEFKKSEARVEVDLKRALQKKEAPSSRRDFLKTFGFTIGAAAVVASCKKPIDKAIPYLVKPEEVTPGIANYYASTYFDANEYCSIVVKTRDGRPIKIEGNELSSISQRGTSARVQAAVLNLYDDARFKGPFANNEVVSWETSDSEIIGSLKKFKEENKNVAFITSTVISPTTKKAISQFLEFYPNVQWIQYDAISASGMLKANELSFGKAFIPDYQFDKAKIVVSFGADFLGTWLSPVEFTKKYTSARKLDDGQTEMLKHFHFEAGMSVTGSNADVRFPIRPSEEGVILAGLYNGLLKAKGQNTVNAPACPIDISSLISELLEKEGQSIIISGNNDTNIQLLVNAINNLLGNYEKTISTSIHLKTRQGIDEKFESFIDELKNNSVSGLVCWGTNPVYDHPDGKVLKEKIASLELSVSLADRPDETTAICKYICPEPHFLENWADTEPKTGFFSLQQPTIQKLFDSRQVEETLLAWTGQKIEPLEYLKNYWEENIFLLQSDYSDFRLFWNDSLQKGVFETKNRNTQISTLYTNGIPEAITTIKPPATGWEVQFYESIAIGNGKFANNPWLQELPDPVAKISWDNFAAVPVKWAEENGVQNESVITINGVEMPVFVQPGQKSNTISIALGYGREIAGKVGGGVGTNMFQLATIQNGAKTFLLTDAEIQVTEKMFELALSQTHHSMEGRPIVRETTFDEWKIDQASGNELHEEFEDHHVTLYEEKEFPGHHWGMAVDLNSCIGCGNCAIACQAENNIQVVGKEQVRNRRIMHWIRIDRYFTENAENPGVSYQPIMCQHCDNAPCENVCPVAATPHSEEGLNQMAYNRCVGTRYCINNCPYRVRRFNWFKYVQNPEFDYNSNSDLGRMVLNPDVTVRSRGVVEKCSFCVQRIQEKKQEAKLDGRPVADGEVQPACVQSCPGNSLVFGDLNDPESKLSKLFKDKRNYHLLEELHTLPSVGYLTKVRNNKA